MEEFMRWLNNEIADIETRTGEDNIFMHARFSEATRIRAMLCQMDAKHKFIDKARVEEVAGVICDKYCKVPGEWTGSNEDMIEVHCDKCPLTELVR